MQSTPSGVCYIHLPNLSSNTSNVEIEGPINGSVAFYRYDPNYSGQMYILYNDGSLFEGDRVALTTYKLEFYTKLPGYGSRGYIMTNMNNQIIKLEVYKSVYMFDNNGCGFTHISFYSPTMTNGTKLERWN